MIIFTFYANQAACQVHVVPIECHNVIWPMRCALTLNLPQPHWSRKRNLTHSMWPPRNLQGDLILDLFTHQMALQLWAEMRAVHASVQQNSFLATHRSWLLWRTVERTCMSSLKAIRGWLGLSWLLYFVRKEAVLGERKLWKEGKEGYQFC